jgi:hypothetical protein
MQSLVHEHSAPASRQLCLDYLITEIAPNREHRELHQIQSMTPVLFINLGEFEV